MLDINLLRNDPEKVRENIRKKFQDQKLPMVDEVIRLDKEYREAIREARNALDEMEKEIEKELCPENPDKSENNNQAVSVRARP